jgi:hypothetical protein
LPDGTQGGRLSFRLWWPNSEFTLHPPICLPCAAAALQYCPYVPTAQAVRVRKPRLWGVFGTGYHPGPNGVLRPLRKGVQCPYANGRDRRWVVAQQAVVELNRCTVVDIEDELAAAGQRGPVGVEQDAPSCMP